MHRVYKRNEYVLYKCGGGYIVQNILMPGFAHTHLKSKDVAFRIIGLSISKKLPNDLSDYMLTSLLRVNNDRDYCLKINARICNRRIKTGYVNCRR